MNWVVAASMGFGLGLAHFGGLWLGVSALKNGKKQYMQGRTARLALASVTFYALLMTGGLVALAAGLGGWLAARWYLVRSIGGASDGR